MPSISVRIRRDFVRLDLDVRNPGRHLLVWLVDQNPRVRQRERLPGDPAASRTAAAEAA